MSARSLLELDLGPHAELVRAALGPASAIGVCDEQGAARWLTSTGEAEPADALGHVLRRAAHEGGAHAPDLCAHAVRGPAGEPLGAVGIRAEDAGAGRVDGFVAALARALGGECALNRELDAMADELGARYDELNLLYTLQRQGAVDGGSGADGRLERIAEDCRELLRIDAVAIYVLEAGLHLQRSGAGVAAQGGIPPSLLTRALCLVREGRGAVVENAHDDPRGERADASSWHLVAAPLLGGRDHVVGVFTIVRRGRENPFTNGDRRIMEALADQASALLRGDYDPLSGLLNRHGLEKQLRARLDTGGPVPWVLMQVSIDQYRLVADSCGTAAAEELLRHVAGLLRARTRVGDLVAHVGGEDFAVLMGRVQSQPLAPLAEKLLRAVEQHQFRWDGKVFPVTASVGAVAADSANGDVAHLLGLADTTREVARGKGGIRAHVYTDRDPDIAAHQGRMEWVPRLNDALARDRFVLYGQPIVPTDPRRGGEPHVEVLLRYLDEDDEIVPPIRFIPAAERYRMMPAVDRWVVSHVFSLLGRHAAEGAPRLPVITVNLSGQSLADEGLHAFVRREAARHRVRCERLCFELTETAAVSSFADTTALIAGLKSDGFQFALDDFGTGFCSFTYLKNLRVDYLKIDGSFVKEIVEDRASEAMVRAINEVGHVMGLRTIAEFVENDAALERLRRIGVDYAQGYGIGRPEPLEALLRRPVADRRAS